MATHVAGAGGRIVRTFELSTRVEAVRRGEGRSATAAAAYRACCVIEDARENRTHDYTRKQGLEAAGIVLPDGAPAWAMDRGTLWNAAEQREINKDKRAKTADKSNAQTAREVFFSFPAELSAAGRLSAARTIAAHLVNAHQVAADFAIHQPGRNGDERNYHCHLLMTTRRLTGKGLGEKVREWADLKGGKNLAKELRAFIAATMNAELKAEGQAGIVFVEHRSFKDRGSAQVPTQHQGPSRTHQLRKQQGMARAAWMKEAATAQRERHAKERAALKGRHDFNLQAKSGELADRERRGIAAIEAGLTAAREADRPSTGLSRVFLWVTGRAVREAFDRNTRETQRNTEAQRQIQALRAGMQTERNAFVSEQGTERRTLLEQHGREDRQLKQAATARVTLDRAAEVTARREAVRDKEQERGGRGRGMEPPGQTLH